MSDNEQGLERLAVAQALYQELGKIVSTRPKSGESLRTQADEALRSAWEDSGISQIRPKVNGVPVGTYSVSLSKPKECVALKVDDAEAFNKWLFTDGSEYVQWLVFKHEAELLDHIKSNGEVPDGCSTHGYIIPESYTGTRLKVDSQKVKEALGKQLPDIAVALLESGENDV